MISVNDVLIEIIKQHPFIEEGLSRDLINYSAYAREIKPQIEEKLYKAVKEGAIVMSLKRISESLKRGSKKKTSLNLSNLTVRSNLSEFTFLNSDYLVDKQRELFNHLGNKKGVFCAVSQGIRETTFIVSSETVHIIEKTFASETMINRIDNLSSITIALPEEVVYIPGVYYQILKVLAWDNINVIEVLSTYTELTVIVENKSVDQAFSALKKLDSLSK